MCAQSAKPGRTRNTALGKAFSQNSYVGVEKRSQDLNVKLFLLEKSPQDVQKTVSPGDEPLLQ